jgi:flagellar biogenesis protein FliO
MAEQIGHYLKLAFVLIFVIVFVVVIAWVLSHMTPGGWKPGSIIGGIRQGFCDMTHICG